MTRFGRLGQPDLGHGGGQIALALHDFRSLNREQRLAGAHGVAHLGEHVNDPPGIGRKDLRCTVIVSGDLPVGLEFDTEVRGADRRER